MERTQLRTPPAPRRPPNTQFLHNCPPNPPLFEPKASHPHAAPTTVLSHGRERLRGPRRDTQSAAEASHRFLSAANPPAPQRDGTGRPDTRAHRAEARQARLTAALKAQRPPHGSGCPQAEVLDSGSRPDPRPRGPAARLIQLIDPRRPAHPSTPFSLLPPPRSQRPAAAAAARCACAAPPGGTYHCGEAAWGGRGREKR